MIIIGPDYVLTRYHERKFSTFTIGNIVYEPENVSNRRAYFAHEMDDEQLSEVKNEMQHYGHLKKVEFRETLPSDWRFSEEF